MALENARAARRGVLPCQLRKRSIPTFGEMAERVMELRESAWRDGDKSSSARDWRNTMERYVYPEIGDLAVDRITSADVLRALRPIWSAKPTTARRLLGRISIVMRVAMAEGHCQVDPAGAAVKAALPNGQHRPAKRAAVPHAEVRDALSTIRRAENVHAGTRLVLELLALTATRSNEARGALWSEIDLENRTWTVPASRTKTGTELRVPLSTGAVAVLEQARELGGEHDLLFPASRGGKIRPAIPSMTMAKLGIAGRPHGFRSSFRTWAAEETDVPREIAEACLGHVIPGVEARYQRSDLLTKRADLMQRWSDYVT